MTRSSRKITATLLAAAGLSSLSPMQQGAALLTAAGAALWASPALAQNNIPGVGVIVKKSPGSGAIIAPTDKDGIVRLSGLEPGRYQVRLISQGADGLIGKGADMMVGADGKLVFVAKQDDPVRPDPRARMAQTAPRQWVEQMPTTGPCRPPYLCDFQTASTAVDINTASDKQLTEGTLNTPETARAIIAERARGGPFKDAVDFAQRVCTKTDVDFGDASLRIGEMVILMKRGSDPKNPGFKCARGTGELELFGRKHNYVGHVTLLR